MGFERAKFMVEQLTTNGGPMDHGQENLRLLVRVVRELAAGRPLTDDAVRALIEDLGINPDSADQFLLSVTERDIQGHVVGAFGLSLDHHPHQFTVGRVAMTTWCAQDTFFLPVILQKEARVVSFSPASGKRIELTVGPDGVIAATPDDTQMSMVVLNTDEIQINTPLDIQMNFCRNIHFFSGRQDFENWAADKPNIVSLSLCEAFELGGHLLPDAYEYARSLPATA